MHNFRDKKTSENSQKDNLKLCNSLQEEHWKFMFKLHFLYIYLKK